MSLTNTNQIIKPKYTQVNKKIIIVCKFPPPYMGTTVWAEALAHSKLKELMNVQFFNTNIHTDLNTMGKIKINSFVKNIFVYYKFILRIIQDKPSLVLIPISQSTIGFLKDSILILISKLLCPRTLLMLHGSNFLNWENKTLFLTKSYIKTVLKGTTGIIVLGEKIKQIFTKWYDYKDIFVVPNGLDINNPNINKETNGDIKILYLGNLQPAKGIEDIIEAMQYIPYKNAELNVIGKWIEITTKDNCLKMSSKSQIKISFHQPKYGHDKLIELFKSDIFVFPPRMPEGHPLVIIEAMAAGLPIISTDRGAITESVIDGVNGFIVESHNPREIADKINYLIENPEVRIQMGKESRRMYETFFTADKMAENLATVFKEVLSKK